MASLDDVVTVQKNGVVAVNALVRSLDLFREIYTSFVGDSSSPGISSDTLVSTSSGRIVTMCVITAAAGGKIYDSATVTAASDENVICAIPNAVGVTAVNFPFFDGLVVKPAAGSVVSISYSEG